MYVSVVVVRVHDIPVYHNGRLYVLANSGDLLAFDLYEFSRARLRLIMANRSRGACYLTISRTGELLMVTMKGVGKT
jgi:hypothetical protein